MRNIFILPSDNGYDDLETVKQIGEEDLKAIGVDNQDDEEVVQHSIMMH